LVELFCPKGHVLVGGRCLSCETEAAIAEEKVEGPYDTIWSAAMRDFREPRTIKVWTRQNEFPNETMKVYGDEDRNVIVFEDSQGRTAQVYKKDIEMILPHWEGYRSGKVPRSWLANGKVAGCQHTKQVVSLLHHFFSSQ